MERILGKTRASWRKPVGAKFGVLQLHHFQQFSPASVFSKGTDFSKLRIQLLCTPWIDAPKRNYSDANSMGGEKCGFVLF